MTLGLLLALGCSSSSAKMISNYPPRWDVTCTRALGHCYERAAEVCPNGFRILDNANAAGAVVQRYGDTAVATPTFYGEIIIDCGQTVPPASPPCRGLGSACADNTAACCGGSICVVDAHSTSCRMLCDAATACPTGCCARLHNTGQFVCSEPAQCQ